MNNKYIYIILFTFLVSVLEAQISIKGKIIDDFESSIETADIILLDNNNKFIKGTSTNENGEFALNYDKNGEYKLEILHVEYQKKSININKSIDLGTITLKPITIELDEMVITADTGINLRMRKGKFVANVQNTTFQNSNNVLDGLKKIPLISVDDNAVKVINKNAIIEINGVKTQMTGEDLSSYLESLEPETVKEIEINSTPDASYDSSVDAVINIITVNKLNNYRVGFRFNNGLRTKYYHNESAYFYLNTEKLNIYTNYSYRDIPRTYTSDISKRVFKTTQDLNYTEENEHKKHDLTLNLGINLNENNTIDLTQIYSYGKSELDGVTKNESFAKEISSNSKNKTLQLAQIWKHTINDSVSLKLGFYEVFKDYEKLNFADTNNSEQVTQNIDTKIPLLIGFLDYSFTNKFGNTSLGVRYNDTKVEDNNNATVGNQKEYSPYNYNEKIAAAYANHQISLGKGKDISFGIRSESSFIDYTFSDSKANQPIKDNKNYTNFLYNVKYSWSSPKWINILSLRKKISRPNYRYLNPFKSISSDVTLFSGNLDINPQKNYSLTYQIMKRNLAFYGEFAYIQDFISTIDELDDNHEVVNTYRNFDDLYYGSVGAYIKHSFFNNIWTTTNSVSFTFFRIRDAYFKEIGESTPNINFNFYNDIKLAKKTYLNITYNLRPTYFDGLITYYANHSLDFNLSKKIGDFSLSVFAKDVFKTNKKNNKMSFKDFSYSSNYYIDSRLFGFSLRWSMSGKAYKDRTIQKPEDNSIDRLED